MRHQLQLGEVRGLLVAVLLIGCGGGMEPADPPDAGPMPDGFPACGEESTCEVINSPPPSCWQESCPCSYEIRRCDNEKICQEWDDCDVDDDGVADESCFQCRYRFYCWCEPRH